MLRSAQPTPRFEQVLAARAGSDVAVLLNAHAKQVNSDVRRALSSVVADEHLYVSRNPVEAGEIAEHVVARRAPHRQERVATRRSSREVVGVRGMLAGPKNTCVLLAVVLAAGCQICAIMYARGGGRKKQPT